MGNKISLNGTWDLTWAEGLPLIPFANYNSGAKVKGREYLKAEVPEATIMTLKREGLVSDPYIGLNSLNATWMDSVFWIYYREFNVERADVSKKAIITFEALEYAAEIKLNGEVVAEHANALRKCEIDLTQKLKEGINTIVVTVESGIFKHSFHDIGRLSPDYLNRVNRRNLMRKPQFQGGWDWNPNLTNVGIVGDVYLEYFDNSPSITDVSLQATVSDDLSAAKLRVSVTLDNFNGEKETDVHISVVDTSIGDVKKIIVNGKTEIIYDCLINNPKLWYPRGYGEQPLYTIKVTQGNEITEKTIGFRKVELRQDPHPVDGQYFIIKINNIPIFFKGGNYVPADAVYSSVTKEHYQKLVDLAVESNFNLLRVWGGAEYMPIAMCEACDRAGIAIWHDFPFACGKYPGDELWFLREVRTEAIENVKKRAHFPSIIVWCGNNEIEAGDKEWGYEITGAVSPHHAIFHDELPRIVKKIAPDTIYWPSSPFSPDYTTPGSPIVGDQHPWSISLGVMGATDNWLHRVAVDRFPNEGGVLGAATRQSAYDFLPDGERNIHSRSWDHHDNPFSIWVDDASKERRCYQTVEMWTGLDVNELSFEDYLFASGLLHAEGLCEYIQNYRRRSFSTSCAIFWMYNDSWPTSHGWTTVDYYLRKKISYYPVARAFNNAFTTPAIDDTVVNIYVVSEQNREYELECGIFTFTGYFPIKSVKKVVAGGEAKVEYSFDLTKMDECGKNNSGAYAILRDEDGKIVSQHRMFISRFNELELISDPKIEMHLNDGLLTITSDTFIWGLTFDVDGDSEVKDNAIDIIPNTPYIIDWDVNKLGEPVIQNMGNWLFKNRKKQ